MLPRCGCARPRRVLHNAVEEQLRPALRRADVLLPDQLYTETGIHDQQWLASIPDFNTLIADSQSARKPVFALTKEDVRRVGKVWESTEKSIERFRKTFDDLACCIEILTGATA